MDMINTTGELEWCQRLGRRTPLTGRTSGQLWSFERGLWWDAGHVHEVQICRSCRKPACGVCFADERTHTQTADSTMHVKDIDGKYPCDCTST